jgi:Ion channel
MGQNAHVKVDEAIRGSNGDLGVSRGILRHTGSYFLVALLLIFVTAPFIEDVRGGELIDAVLMTAVLLSAVMAIGGRRETLVWAIVLVTPALVGKWLNHWRPDLMPPEVFLGAALLFVVFVILHLLRFVLRAARVDFEILCLAVSNYLMLGWLWAFAYMLTDRLAPDSFAFTVGHSSGRLLEGFRAFYFSYSTMTTVAYGDIIPLSNAARMLATLEAMTGMLYVALLIARLVSLYYSGVPSKGGKQ